MLKFVIYISTAFLSNQDSSFDLIRLIANGCVYFQSFRPKQSTIIQSKLRAYLREDLNDTTIQSFDWYISFSYIDYYFINCEL